MSRHAHDQTAASKTVSLRHHTDAQALSELPTAELLHRAATRRDKIFGRRITYSPKVFIPLTKLCRDRCEYCTFAQPPANVESLFLEPQEVLAIARKGADAGCHEALFTLGERPELRYPDAARWLEDRGYATTVDYLAEMCRLVYQETGLLPHANPGSMSHDELALLRPVAASQGMMIESLREDLKAHRNAPDKAPRRRLQTLQDAGKLDIVYTTGILVGIGESEEDRIIAIEAIAEAARRYGHIQEVIVQNFLPKPGTAMWRDDPPSRTSFVRAVGLARILLPNSVHLQAPPNLSEEVGSLLEAGIDDLGGISPVTIDHVNPERPWPQIGLLSKELATSGFRLAPRLTVYPEYVTELDRWIDPDLQFGVLDHSDAEGLARDDPGPFWPNRFDQVVAPKDGAEVQLKGKRKTTWYSGSEASPPSLIPTIDLTPADTGIVSDPRVSKPIGEVLDAASPDAELGQTELRTLFSARGDDVLAIARRADQLRQQLTGGDITYVVNRNINYTNVCTFKCRFCGFSKGPLSLNLRGEPYLLSLEEIQQRVTDAVASGATEVCLQGGIHPSFDGDYYIDVCRAVRQAAPRIHIHGFTALEVFEGARRSGETVEDYLAELKSVGLNSLPGTAAEILDDDVRQVLCPDKISSEQWLGVHEAAHGIGLRSNVTMMFGAVEGPDSWVKHLLVTRALQHRTGGFTEFVGLPFVHMASPIYLQKNARRGPTFRETLLVHSVARLAYGNLIKNIQASWVKVGFEGVQQLLTSGCNDIGGTLTNENISRAAGANHGQRASVEDFSAVAAQLTGRQLRQRSTLYGFVDSN